MELLSQIKKEIHTHQLLKRGDTVIVGVSGGADSTALLLILHSLQHYFGLRLIAAHFNHNLRSSARNDEEFVKKLSTKLNVKFVSKTWAQGKPKAVSEDLARQKRFQFLIQTAKKFRGDSIALAHTLDDVAETVLMRILRGSGLMGLRAILPKRDINKIRVIRPILKLKRSDVEAYLKKNGQSFCLDPSNKEEKYFRNKIRLRLLPLLENTFSPQIKELLANLAESASFDYDYLEKNARQAFARQAILGHRSLTFKMNPFLKQPTAIRRMMLRLAAEYLKGDFNRLTLKHLTEAEDMLCNRHVGSIVSWPDRLRIIKEKNVIRILR